MNAENYAFFCATTVQQSGFIKMLVSRLDVDMAKNALLIKASRIALIVPLTLIITTSMNLSHKSMKSFMTQWAKLGCLAGFVLVGVAFSYLAWLTPYADGFKRVNHFAWTYALTSVGFMVNMVDIHKSIIRTVALGFLLWVALIAVLSIGCFGLFEALI